MSTHLLTAALGGFWSGFVAWIVASRPNRRPGIYTGAKARP
jgi:hypothetical protein